MSMQVRCLICSEILNCNPHDTTNLVEHVRKCHPEIQLQSSSTDILSNINKQEHNERDQLRISYKNHNHMFTAPQVLCRKKSNYSQVSRRPSIKTEEQRSSVSSQKRKSSSEFFDAYPPKDEQKTSPDEVFELHNPEQTVTTKDNESEKDCLKKNDETIQNNDNNNTGYRRKYNIKNPFPFSKKGKEKLYKTSIEKWRPGKGRICCPSCGAIRRPLIKSHIEKSSTTPLGAACIVTCWPFCFLPCLFPPPAKEYLHCSNCNHFLGVYDRQNEVIEPADVKCK